MITMLLLPLLLQSAEPRPDCNQTAADQGVQQAINQCAYRDYLIADADMNAQWKQTAAIMKARDTEFAASASAEFDKREGHFKSLLEAQRAWLRYRDAHCRLDGYTARGGSMEPMLVSFCKSHLTRQRTEQLKALVESAA